MRSFPGDTNMDRRVMHCNGRIGGFSLMRVVWYGALCLAFTGVAFGQNQQQQKNQPQQPQNVPSAPVPQAPAPQPNSLQKLAGQVTPGIGTNSPDVVGSQNAGQSGLAGYLSLSQASTVACQVAPMPQGERAAGW